jgi:hypothetical protein
LTVIYIPYISLIFYGVTTVVKSVCIQRNRIFADGKYLVDSHVLTTAGKDMQYILFESSLWRVRLHNPNKMLVIAIL